MKAPAIPLVHAHAETAPHQELAAAVVRQAITDLEHPSEMVRDSAMHFLAGSDEFSWWCGVAGLEPHHVRAWMRRPGWRRRWAQRAANATGHEPLPEAGAPAGIL